MSIKRRLVTIHLPRCDL